MSYKISHELPNPNSLRSNRFIFMQNIKGNLAGLFNLVYRSHLARNSLNSFHIDFKIIRNSYLVASSPVWNVPWTTWRPQDPIPKIRGSSFLSLWAFNFVKTLQFVFGPSIESNNICFSGKLAVELSNAATMLSALGHLKKWESK